MGKIDKQKFLIGQKAFIVRNGKVLIIQRQDKSTKSGLWDFPGGRLDYSESLRQGLMRETKEEVGLKLKIISIPLSIITFLQDLDRGTQITRIIYLCSAIGKVKLSHEHSNFKWINPKNYNKYKLVSGDYKSSFKNYMKFKPKLTEFLGTGMTKESLKYKTNH